MSAKNIDVCSIKYTLGELAKQGFTVGKPAVMSYFCARRGRIFAMKTVLEACRPHQGIIDGTLNLEVFTAALGPVIDYYHKHGKANIDKVYTDAELFFREATYPTDGLKQLLSNVFRRISGDMTADSVMKLETAFGGGKTHSLISCVHIAYRGKELKDVTQGLIDSSYLPEAGTVSVVGIAGDELAVRKTQGDKLSPYTIWGEMALQLGGESLYREVKDEAEEYAAPGLTFFEKVLGNRKVILMFDELAQYASRLEVVLPGKGADQLSAFLMSLNNYAQNHAGIAVIVTLASSSDAFAKQTEALSQKLNDIIGTNQFTKDDAGAIAQRASKSAGSVISRNAKPVTPVQASEIAPILAKRLFTSIDMSAAQEVSHAYAEMYAKNAALLPEEANMANFAQRMVENYPFHPTFIDYLNNKLSLAENFQGTRGVLRVLALTIRNIWQKSMPISLIHTCNVDMRNAATVDEILGRTGSADLKTALNTDIGSVETASLGSGLSQAERADRKNPHPDGLPMYELTWKTVFLNSLVARGEGKTAKAFGINQQDALFMISSPVLPPSQVNTALEEIGRSAFYLRCEDGKYFAHQDPTLNSVLAQIRENVNTKRIQQKLKSLAGTLLSDNHLFNVQQDVRLPQDIPDNNTKPTVAVIALDAKEIDPMKLLQEKGANMTRLHQNMVVMLIPSTVRVLLDNDSQNLFGSDIDNTRPLSYVEDLARQVIAINDLKDKPTSYGINAHKLEDPEFVETSREREMALSTEVAALYKKVYFANNMQIECREIRTDSGDSGATILNQIAQTLIEANKLIYDKAFNTTELKSLQSLFFANGERLPVAEMTKGFYCNRRWPMLSNTGVLERILREGVASGVWIIYRMGDSTDDVPAEIYTQENPVAMGADILRGGYSLMTIEGAKKRPGWLEKDHVPPEKIQARIKEVLAASGASPVSDLQEAVKATYANVSDEQITEGVREVLKTAGFSGYVGDVNQQEKPENIIEGYSAQFHDIQPTDIIITQREKSERGWLEFPGSETFLGNISDNERAHKIYKVLKNISGWYNRGKAQQDIEELELVNLRLPSGATMRIRFDGLTSRDIKKLDELFMDILGVAEVSEHTEGYITIQDTSNEDDELIKELKKQGD